MEGRFMGFRRVERGNREITHKKLEFIGYFEGHFGEKLYFSGKVASK